MPNIPLTEIVQNDQLLAQLSSEHYDVAIAEFYDTCPFAFFHRIGVRTKLGAMALPLVQGTARFFGIPTFSSFVPSEASSASRPMCHSSVNCATSSHQI
jgi:hypothetical protein